MAFSYQQIYDVLNPLPTTPGQFALRHPLEKQVSIAMSVAALAITNEDPATPNHAKRLAWAQQSLTNPSMSLTKFLLAIVHAPETKAHPDLAAIADTEVLTLLTAQIDKLI
ncbi:MAG: hypothetical protein NVS9B4_01100 [Candidatus Acidiferrum sp.]